MLKALLSRFNMSECFYTFALYDAPMNFTSSTARLSSPMYVPRDSSTETNLESSRWDMKLPDISSFAADIQWRLDTHWGFWIIHVVSRTKSISKTYPPLGLGPVKSRSRSVMPMPSPYNVRDSITLGGKQIRYAFLVITSLSSQIRGYISRVSTGSGANLLSEISYHCSSSSSYYFLSSSS